MFSQELVIDHPKDGKLFTAVHPRIGDHFSDEGSDKFVYMSSSICVVLYNYTSSIITPLSRWHKKQGSKVFSAVK